MKYIKDFLPHLSIAMLLGLAVLVLLDERNPLMNFLTSSPSKIYLLIVCAVGLAVAVMFISERRK